MPNSPTSSIWLRVFACLGVVIIACGVKNYLAVLVTGTPLCPYLCPSVFPSELYFHYPLLESLFEAQRWVLEQTERLADALFLDPWNLAATLLFAPIYEEVIFRGPMYLARRFADKSLWWVIGAALAAIFALSHGRNGLALLPLFVLGICGLWLIAATQRFWPTIVLHFLHNFFFSSALVYHSLSLGD
jgi:membrane protease YdiL (CAAX protease family)